MLPRMMLVLFAHVDRSASNLPWSFGLASSKVRLNTDTHYSACRSELKRLKAVELSYLRITPPGPSSEAGVPTRILMHACNVLRFQDASHFPLWLRVRFGCFFRGQRVTLLGLALASAEPSMQDAARHPPETWPSGIPPPRRCTCRTSAVETLRALVLAFRPLSASHARGWTRGDWAVAPDGCTVRVSPLLRTKVSGASLC